MNRYDYQKVIQGHYGGSCGWEDVSIYPDTHEGRADARRDVIEYRMGGHPHRIISRRVKNFGAILQGLPAEYVECVKGMVHDCIVNHYIPAQIVDGSEWTFKPRMARRLVGADPREHTAENDSELCSKAYDKMLQDLNAAIQEAN